MRGVEKFTIAILFGIVLIALELSHTSIPGLNFGKRAQDFTLTDVYGGSFRLSDYAGEVVLLNFFTTW